MICDPTFHVKPDPAKGTIVITDGDYIGTKKLKWINNDTAQIEETAFLIPKISKFSKVTASKDRVYILKNTETRLFFYMQEPDPTKDQEIALKLNELINEQPQPAEDLPEAQPQAHSNPQQHPPHNPHNPQAQNTLSEQQLAQLLRNPELLQSLMGGLRQQTPECKAVM